MSRSLTDYIMVFGKLRSCGWVIQGVFCGYGRIVMHSNSPSCCFGTLFARHRDKAIFSATSSVRHKSRFDRCQPSDVSVCFGEPHFERGIRFIVLSRDGCESRRGDGSAEWFRYRDATCGASDSHPGRTRGDMRVFGRHSSLDIFSDIIKSCLWTG